jgi:CubicO group peptidase (beta-lactamase class C family)
MRRMQRLLVSIATLQGLAGALGTLHAQTSETADSLVLAFITRRNIPSAAIAVVRDGRIVKTAGYGTANLELRIPASAHSVYEVGSITKQFSAEAVMVLVEERKLALDDSLARYLPEIPDAWRGIRLRHLLTHTSGLHDWEADASLSFRREYTTSEFIALVAAHPLDFAPGTRVAYTNSAYPLLGRVIERVAGVPYERFVAERIFGPAGMTETRFRHNARLVPNRASGYVERDGVIVNGEPLRPAILAPNGGIQSTATDMARWMVALARGRLVRPSTLATMTTPARLGDGSTVGVGIGWFLADVDGHRAAVHNGSTAAGYSSVVYRYLDDDVGVVVLFNIDRFDAVNVLARSLARLYLRREGGAARRAPRPGDRARR